MAALKTEVDLEENKDKNERPRIEDVLNEEGGNNDEAAKKKKKKKKKKPGK